MDKDDFLIRQMTRPELEGALTWAEKEGWNPGLHDGDSFFQADHGGFLLGLNKGEPIASISAVRYGNNFGFIGLYIVCPAYRKQGFGMLMWQAAMALLGNRVIGLDGVVERQADYGRSGFAIACRNVRFEGQTTGPCEPGGVIPLSEVSAIELAGYDAGLFAASRDRFLQSWVRQRGSCSFALMREGTFAGYGVIRPSRNGFRIGPLFAEDEAGAELLFQALNSSVPAGHALFIDIPEPNGRALAMAERHGMSRVFETARMYRGEAPRLPLQRIFGVTTYELG